MLYVIPTPIGNIEDITIRGLRHFREVPLIISENTFTTKKLLKLHNITYDDKKFIKFTSHDHKSIQYIGELLKHNDWALVSEAGTPGLSDPGKLLIIHCQEQQIWYTILPGATALIPAVIAAGFPTTHRLFQWFLPHKKWREKTLQTAIMSDFATFFYESVHRIPKLIEQLEKLNFMGKISLSREVSKHFEQNITGNLSTLQSLIKNWDIPMKWEFVIGIYPYSDNDKTKMDDDHSSD